MKFKWFFFLVLFGTLISCIEKIIDKPDNLISKEMMAKIYYDLAIVTAAKNTNNAILKKHHIEGMDYIYTKYGIDSVQFVQSDLYYASNPDIYKEIYENSEKRIKEDVKVIEDEKELKRKQDSIERAKSPKELDSLIVQQPDID